MLETIRIEKGIAQNICAHNERLHRTRKTLFNCTEPLNIEERITPEMLHLDPDLTYKCRVLYNETIQKTEYLPYRIRPIRSLKMVEGTGIKYAHKYANRDAINELLPKRGACDDILIIQGNYITDTSYCNILFWDGKKWLTPAIPLLKGTMRSKLLKDGAIEKALLKKNDLKLFKKAKLINAMMDMDNGIELEIGQIF